MNEVKQSSTMTNPQLLYYDVISKFKDEYFKELITVDNLQGGEIFMNSLTYPDGGKDDSANFWGYTFEKDNKKYLLSSRLKNKVTGETETINLANYLPFKPSDMQKVAYKAQVFYLVNKPLVAKFKSEKKMSFKDLIDTICLLKHSNQRHRKLLTMLAMASMLDRTYFRLSTPPSFGKDSIVDTLASLIGGCATIVQPTLAKLEYRTNYKWLVVNEVVDLGKAEWRLIEQFLLDAAAHKPIIEKHSRAQEKGKELLDIGNFSLSLFYNDIDKYPEPDKYVDFVTKQAVLDRFPAFRLHGYFMEDFNSIKTVDTSKLVAQNMNFYKDLVYTLTYYKQNLNYELHHYKTNKIVKSNNSRWVTNIGRLLKIVDLYCDSQEEFDSWLITINESLRDYEEMLKYQSLLKVSRCSDIDSVYKAETFIEKNKLLRGENIVKENTRLLVS